MKESQIESYMVRKVKEHGGLCFKFVSPGNPGVPDRIVITQPERPFMWSSKRKSGGWPRCRNGSGANWRNGGRMSGCFLGWTP